MSFVCGTSDHPLIYQTIGDALDHAVEQWGENEAIVVPTCHALQPRSSFITLVNRIIKSGFQQGYIVALLK